MARVVRVRSFVFATTSALLLAIALLPQFARANPTVGAVPPPPPGFTLTWADDFKGPMWQAADPNSWLYDTGHGYGCAGCPDQWGTFEIESMSTSPKNVSLDGQGHLLLTPIRDAAGNWTSGRIETRRTDFTAGDHGVLRVEGNYLNWPGIGEIDIMENINGRPTAFSTLHCGVPVGGPCNETNGIGGTTDNATLQDGFHTYAMELDKSVTPNELRFYLDGANYFTIRSTQVPADTWDNATNHGFFVILDMAIGGAFPWAECNFFPHPGGCSGSTPFPEVATPATVSGVPLKVAYVAVYNK